MGQMKVLFVGGEPEKPPALTRLFSLMGFSAEGMPGEIEAVARAAKGYDLVVLDASGEDHNGLEVLHRMSQYNAETPVVVLLGYAPPKSPSEIIRLGAFDCISEPFEIERMKIVIERAVERRRMLQEIKRLREMVAELTAIRPLRSAERDHIKRVLESTAWNQTRAAQILEIDRKTLRNKIREFRLQKPSRPQDPIAHGGNGKKPAG